jgi:hypothetical protein
VPPYNNLANYPLDKSAQENKIRTSSNAKRATGSQSPKVAGGPGRGNLGSLWMISWTCCSEDYCPQITQIFTD